MYDFNYPDILPLPSLPASFPHSVYDDSRSWYQELVNIIEYCNEVGSITNDMRSWLDEFIKTYGEKNNEVLNQIFNEWSKTPKTIEILKNGVFNNLMKEIKTLDENKMNNDSIINWAQIGQDVREHIDGTGTGNNTDIITTENISNSSVTRPKTNYYSKNISLNKFDYYNVTNSKDLINGELNDNIDRCVSEFIPTNNNTVVYLQLTGKIAFYDGNKNFIQQYQSVNGMNIPDTSKFLRVDTLKTNLNESYVGFEESSYTKPTYIDEFLGVTNENMKTYNDRHASILYGDDLNHQKTFSINEKNIIVPSGTIFIFGSINGQYTYNNVDTVSIPLTESNGLLVYNKTLKIFEFIQSVNRKEDQLVVGFINNFILKMYNESKRKFKGVIKLGCSSDMLPIIDWDNNKIEFTGGIYTGFSDVALGGFSITPSSYTFTNEYFGVFLDLNTSTFKCINGSDYNNVDISSLLVIGYVMPELKISNLNISINQVRNYDTGNLINEYRYPNVFTVDYVNYQLILRVPDETYPWFVQPDKSPSRYPVDDTIIDIPRTGSPQVLYFDYIDKKLKFISHDKYLNVCENTIYLGKVAPNLTKHYLSIKSSNGSLDNIINSNEAFNYNATIVNPYNKVKPIIDYVNRKLIFPKISASYPSWNWFIFRDNIFKNIQLTDNLKDENGDVVINLLETAFQFIVYDLQDMTIKTVTNEMASNSSNNYIKIGLIMVMTRVSYLNFPVDNSDLYNLLENSGGGNTTNYDFEKNNIIIFGDSLSTYKKAPENTSNYPAFYPNGDIDNVNKTWWKPIFNKYGNNCYNASWSGGCLTDIIPTTKNGNQILNETILPTTPNVLLFMYGTNDYGKGVSSEVFNQSLETFVQTARNKWSGVIIYVCSYPFNKRMYDGVVVNSENVTTWSEAVENKAKELGCKTIDILNVGNNSDNWNLFNIGDGVHYNAKGAKLIKNNVIQQVAEFN